MIKSLLRKKDKPIKTYQDFWDWFKLNERKFHEVVNKGTNIPKGFFNKIAPKLNELRAGYWYLSGMYDNKTAELIITADGVIENIVYVEELIACAPKLNNWRFTALKPEIDMGDSSIQMNRYAFGLDTLSFYYTEDKDYPDDINLTIIHKNFKTEDKASIVNGVYIFLDNYLGELKTATIIDELDVIGQKDALKEVIPISKLKDFLVWREKEFVEKYEGTRRDTENDSYSSLEATLKNGSPIVAIINTDILNWDSKASHPWVSVVTMTYNGSKNNGLPDDNTYQILNDIEEEINDILKDKDGYINIGRDSGDNNRHIYFAFRDFRAPSKVLQKLKEQHQGKLRFQFEIYKDKYWRTFEKYNPHNHIT